MKIFIIKKNVNKTTFKFIIIIIIITLIQNIPTIHLQRSQTPYTSVGRFSYVITVCESFDRINTRHRELSHFYIIPTVFDTTAANRTKRPDRRQNSNAPLTLIRLAHEIAIARITRLSPFIYGAIQIRIEFRASSYISEKVIWVGFSEGWVFYVSTDNFFGKCSVGGNTLFRLCVRFSSENLMGCPFSVLYYIFLMRSRGCIHNDFNIFFLIYSIFFDIAYY